MIVTGASSGIGKAIYERYRSSMSVLGVSLVGPDVVCDLGSLKELNGWLVGSDRPVCSVLVLNHGVAVEDEYRDWEKIFRTNFWSYWMILEEHCRGPAIVQPGGSVIINASSCGVSGDWDLRFYAAMKAALLNLVKSYAVPLWKVWRVRINAISCGLFRTGMFFEPASAALLSRVPLAREAHPDEILPVVDMLIRCEYIVGQNVVVDGGLLR